MLTTKRINLGISVISRALRIILILYSASILANCVWWVLFPAEANVFIQWADLDTRDKVTSYINNRYPFGIVVIAKPKEKERPRIVDQLKLTGVYLNTAKDSFAFLEYQGKPIVARIGAEIATSGAIVKSINVDNIVVFADDQDATIKVTTGGAQSSGAPSTFGASNNSNPDTMFGNRPGNNPQNNYNNQTSSSSNSQAIEDFRQQRRRVLEEFNARNNSNQARESSSDDQE